MSGEATERKVIFSQIAHRHGARTPLVSVNGSILCGSLGCGNLNQDGKDMLVSIGKWARNRYINDSSPIDHAYLRHQNIMNYSSNYIGSRSTNLARTIQSADGFLRGFFPDLDQFYPVIGTVSFWSDTLLLVDALAAYHLPAYTETQQNWKKIEPKILAIKTKDGKQAFTVEVIQAIGEETSLYEICVTNMQIANCLLQAQDVAASFNATGQASSSRAILRNGSFPITLENLDNLQEVRFLWNSMFFPYDPVNDPHDAETGSLGQNLAQEIVASMHMAIDWANSRGGLPYVFKEWSAHDTTMMPLCATLGANDLMLPLFGEAFFFELLQEGAGNASQYFVRALYGHPVQGPGDHIFNPQPFPLRCMNSNHVVYNGTGTDRSCPLEDWHRFINSSKPTTQEGLCYVQSSVLKSVDCLASNNSSPEAGSECVFYRQHCPEFACGPDGYLVFPSYQCLPTKLMGVEPGTVSIIILSSVGAGLLIGGVFASIFVSKKLKGSKGYTSVQ